MSFKQILAMGYGSVAQIEAADAWYNRFGALLAKPCHEYLPECFPQVWDAIHLTDVGYMARQRWLSRQEIM